MVQLLESEKKSRDNHQIRWDRKDLKTTVEGLDDFFTDAVRPRTMAPTIHDEVPAEMFEVLSEATLCDHEVSIDSTNHVAGACANAVQRKSMEHRTAQRAFTVDYW